jgi:hypothetical protein
MMRKERIAYEECGAQAVVTLNGSNVSYCEEHARAYCEAEGIIIAEETEGKKDEQQNTM